MLHIPVGSRVVVACPSSISAAASLSVHELLGKEGTLLDYYSDENWVQRETILCVCAVGQTAVWCGTPSMTRETNR